MFPPLGYGALVQKLKKQMFPKTENTPNIQVYSPKVITNEQSSIIIATSNDLIVYQTGSLYNAVRNSCCNCKSARYTQAFAAAVAFLGFFFGFDAFGLPLLVVIFSN
jgi:hypothetical protein